MGFFKKSKIDKIEEQIVTSEIYNFRTIDENTESYEEEINRRTEKYTSIDPTEWEWSIERLKKSAEKIENDESDYGEYRIR